MTHTQANRLRQAVSLLTRPRPKADTSWLNLLFSLFSAASDPACPKSGRISDLCRGSLAALQAEHTFRLKFPIELAGAHSILSQPERERSKPNFYIVQFGSLGTSADGCSVKGRHTLMPLGGHRPASIEESSLLRRSFCHPRLDTGLDLGGFSVIAGRLGAQIVGGCPVAHLSGHFQT